MTRRQRNRARERMEAPADWDGRWAKEAGGWTLTPHLRHIMAARYRQCTVEYRVQYLPRMPNDLLGRPVLEIRGSWLGLKRGRRLRLAGPARLHGYTPASAERRPPDSVAKQTVEPRRANHQRRMDARIPLKGLERARMRCFQLIFSWRPRAQLLLLLPYAQQSPLYLSFCLLFLNITLFSWIPLARFPSLFILSHLIIPTMSRSG